MAPRGAFCATRTSGTMPAAATRTTHTATDIRRTNCRPIAILPDAGNDTAQPTFSLFPFPFSLFPFPFFLSNPAMAKKKSVRRRKKAAAKSLGLSPEETGSVSDPALSKLMEQVRADGGTTLTAYRDPIGGTPVLLAALPIDRVEPTPFQR